MSKKKSNNYSDLSVDELNKKLKDFKTEHFNLRFQVVVNQLENLARFKVVKKEIARIKTELNKPSRKSEPVKA
jgi:large subunit ribosomal protein L29